MKNAAETNLKRVTLELGGKSAAILLQLVLHLIPHGRIAQSLLDPVGEFAAGDAS